MKNLTMGLLLGTILTLILVKNFEKDLIPNNFQNWICSHIGG